MKSINLSLIVLLTSLFVFSFSSTSVAGEDQKEITDSGAPDSCGNGRYNPPISGTSYSEMSCRDTVTFACRTYSRLISCKGVGRSSCPSACKAWVEECLEHFDGGFFKSFDEDKTLLGKFSNLKNNPNSNPRLPADCDPTGSRDEL